MNGGLSRQRRQPGKEDLKAGSCFECFLDKARKAVWLSRVDRKKVDEVREE